MAARRKRRRTTRRRRSSPIRARATRKRRSGSRRVLRNPFTAAPYKFRDVLSAKVLVPAAAGAGGFLAAFGTGRFISRLLPQATTTVFAQRATNIAGYITASLGSFFLARQLKVPALNFAGLGAMIGGMIGVAADFGLVSFSPPVFSAAGLFPATTTTTSTNNAVTGATAIQFDEEDVADVETAFGL